MARAVVIIYRYGRFQVIKGAAQINPFPDPGYCLFGTLEDVDAATRRVPRRGLPVAAQAAGCCARVRQRGLWPRLDAARHVTRCCWPGVLRGAQSASRC